MKKRLAKKIIQKRSTLSNNNHMYKTAILKIYGSRFFPFAIIFAEGLVSAVKSISTAISSALYESDADLRRRFIEKHQKALPARCASETNQLK